MSAQSFCDTYIYSKLSASNYCNSSLRLVYTFKVCIIQDTRQDTRYKIFYFRHEAHSYNTIYIHVNNKIQCIIYNDKKYYINFSNI